MSEPGQLDSLLFDHKWGLRRVRRLAVASEVDSNEVEWKLEDESDYLERVQQLERDAEEEDEEEDAWVQCDACQKWRLLHEDDDVVEEGMEWTCADVGRRCEEPADDAAAEEGEEDSD
jgi:hypothetical protein